MLRFMTEGRRMAKPAVILVGADKGGVGKTTVSRALLDYLIAQSIPTRAFDTESPRGTLHYVTPRTKKRCPQQALVTLDQVIG